MITDANGFGFKQMRHFSINNAKIMASFIQTSFPLWFRQIHIVNAPAMFIVIFNMIKPFLAETVQKKMNFHSNLESLHEVVNKDILPQELGGNGGHFDNSLCIDQTKSMEPYFKALKDILDDK